MKEKIELYKNWINSKTAKIFFVIIAIINSKIIFCSLASMVEDNKLPIILLFLFVVICNLVCLWNPKNKILNKNEYLTFVTITLIMFVLITIGSLSYFGLNFFMNIETELNLKMDY
jgi:hypothetical protein